MTLRDPNKDSNEKKLIQMIKIHTDKNVADLLTKAFDATVKVKTVNGEHQLQDLVDGKKIIITEATVRIDLQLEDVDGVDCLPNVTIFEQLTLIGFLQVFLNNQLEGMATHNMIYIATSHTKKIFANMRRQGKDFSGRETPLFPTMMVQAQEEIGEGSAMLTDLHHTPIITQPSSSQPQRKQKSRRPKEKDTQVPQTSVPSDSTNVADEAVHEEPSMKLKELMSFYTKLQQRVLDLENTKTAQTQEITSLKKRVKKLEKKGGSRTYKLKRLYRVGRSANVVSFDKASLGDHEDASKQGMKFDDIDVDEDITLENVHDAEMLDINDLHGDEVVVESEVTDKAGEKRNIVEEAVAVTDVVIIPVSAATITNVMGQGSKDKGKAKMIEPEKPLKKKDQIKFDEEEALRLQANFDEEDKIAREKAQQVEEANIAWDDIQEKIDADYQLAERLQA
ncbi:hypothetical protein Tco_1292978 [Tanacetum coccineum]